MYYNKKKNLAKKKDEAKEEGKEKKDTKKIIDDDIPRQLGDYQLMEAIGRGGFGTVYRGISVVSGQTVAVKRVGLHGIPQEELESIEMEIRLLQNLVHANIVKYLDSMRTQEHLNIILEYVENGSLSTMLTKFPNSRMPESLVCHYVAQVLKGLHYLHTQGVIHRDIKGANILSTKDGFVKLADFGVATKISESRKSDSVVGTPYWMAPEIIEMTGQQSSACDIWSVGCTAIELFTGKPPYFDLQQMPALFRIVQDEHPPLPDNISPAMESFLLECFQKDPNRRIDAHGLLRHQWLKNVVGLSDEIEHEAAAAAAVAASASAMRKSTASSPPTIETPTIHDSDTEENWDEEIAEEEAAAAAAAGSGSGSGPGSGSGSGVGSPAIAVHPAISPLSPSSARGPPPLTVIKKLNNSSSLSLNHHAHKLGETEEKVFDIDEIEEPAESVSDLKSKSSIKSTDKLKGAAHAVVFSERLRSKTGIGAELTGTTNMMRPGGTKKLEEFQEDEENEKDDWELEDVAIDVNKLDDRKETHHTALDVPDDINEVDEDDPFNDITFEEDRAVDEDIQVSKAFLRVIAQLTPKNDEKMVLEACDTLNEMGAKNPEQMRSLMTAHGVIPIMEMLEITNPNILHAVLKVVNQIVGKNHSFQQSMSLVGLIPAIIRFASGNFPAEIRLEAANFVRQFCYASDFTRKMFIACDGLPVLVGFLQEEYFQSKTLVWNAIDCIRHVFDITSNPKNDFCRLFCKFGLLPPLTRTLELVNADKDSDVAQEYVLKIAKILHLFSQGDPVVKTHFAKPEVIENMLHVLPSLPQEVLILVLKSIRNISMDPMTLDLLEAAGAIPALVPFLSSPYPENQHQVLLTMYYLCQIKPSRQEQAALSGVIPHLQRFVRENHPLKQFAFPIIFLLAKTSNRSRLELKKYAGVQFYLDVLEDVYWRTHALEVLAAWLQEDPVKVGFILNTSSNINKLLTVFRTTTKTVQFEKMLPLFRKMLSCSIRVNQAFGRSQMFIMEIKHRLEKHTHSNSIRINLLKILALVFVAHQSSSRLIRDHDLLPVLIRLSEEKSSVIVMSLAQKLVEKFKNTTTIPIQPNIIQPQQAIVAH